MLQAQVRERRVGVVSVPNRAAHELQGVRVNGNAFSREVRLDDRVAERQGLRASAALIARVLRAPFRRAHVNRDAGGPRDRDGVREEHPHLYAVAHAIRVVWAGRRGY